MQLYFVINQLLLRRNSVLFFNNQLMMLYKNVFLTIIYNFHHHAFDNSK